MQHWKTIATATLLSLILGPASLIHAAGTASLSLTPASGTISVGQKLVVDVKVNSGSAGDMISGIKVNITIPTNLQYTSFSASTSDFPTTVTDPSVSGNVITMTRVRTDSGFSGTNGELLQLTFTALSSGSAALTIDQANSEVDNSSSVNVLGTVNNGNYTVTGGSIATTGTPTPSAAVPPIPTARPVATNTTKTKSIPLPSTGLPAPLPLLLLLPIILAFAIRHLIRNQF